MEVLRMNGSRSEHYHITDQVLLSLSDTALSIVVIAPGVNAAILSQCQGMMGPALDLNRVFINKDFQQDWRVLVRSIDIADSQLSMCVRPHRVHQVLV